MRKNLRRLVLFLIVLLLASSIGFLLPFPLSWTACLVSGQADYFYQDEETWIRQHSYPQLLWVKLLDFKVRYDIKKRLAERIRLTSQQPAASIYAATREIRQAYITQLQAPVPIISGSTMASFVRGFGYCDHINGFLAYTLTDYLNKVQLYALKNEFGQSPHALVRTESALGVVWIDAFTCIDAFGFSDELSALGKQKIPHFNQVKASLQPASYYQKAVFINDYTFAHTSKKAIGRLSSRFAMPVTPGSPSAANSIRGKVVGIEMAVNKGQQKQWLQTLAAESTANKQRFLKARVLQLYGEPEEAAALFQEVIDASPKGLLASYSRIFLHRITENKKLCQDY